MTSSVFVRFEPVASVWIDIVPSDWLTAVLIAIAWLFDGVTIVMFSLSVFSTEQHSQDRPYLMTSQTQEFITYQSKS